MENETSDRDGTTVKSCAEKQKNWNADTDIDLLLLGKTGNGKSATGNSILRRQVFESSGSASSVTTEVNVDYSEFDGQVIKVVDVRGVQDTRETQSKALFIREMAYAIAANPKGYHAFLIVLKYGVRFDQEQVDTIRFLKTVFGETFARDHCIIVMTGGDMFNNDNRSKGISFRSWCDKEEGYFPKLIQECSNKIVLFNNWCEDEDEKKQQIVELLNLVDHLNGARYTDENFKQAELAQTKLIMQPELADIRGNALKETRLILQKLKYCQESLLDEQEALENLLLRTETFMEELLTLDKNTKLLQDLIENIGDIKSNIHSEMKVQIDIRECRKSFEEDLKIMELNASAEKEIVQNQYLKSIEKCSVEDKKRLKKELEEKIKKIENSLEKEKKSKENESFCEINQRREKLKSEREKLEAKCRETIFNKLKRFLRIIFYAICKALELMLDKLKENVCKIKKVLPCLLD